MELDPQQRRTLTKELADIAAHAARLSARIRQLASELGLTAGTGDADGDGDK